MIVLRRLRRSRSKLVIYRTESTNPIEAYGFRVIAGNGEQVGQGEGYTTPRDAVRGGRDLISGRHAGAEVVMPS